MSDTSTFWGRRRAAVEAEAEADAREVEEARVAAVHQQLAEKDDATVLHELGLPDPDAMQAGDDFTAFMAKEVPEYLRNRALRTLWRSNPVLACVDGLNEYDDDYRAAMLAQGPIQTAYQVGKGMLSHLEEMARQEEQRDTEEEVVAEAAPADDALSTEHQEEPEELEAVDVAEVEMPAAHDPAPRRMRFRFEEAGV